MSNFLLGGCSLMYKEGFRKFSHKKIFIFRVPAIFENVNFDAPATQGGVILKKNATHSMLCQIVGGPQFQNFMCF